jgi:hypothetical protein
LKEASAELIIAKLTEKLLNKTKQKILIQYLQYIYGQKLKNIEKFIFDGVSCSKMYYFSNYFFFSIFIIYRLHRCKWFTSFIFSAYNFHISGICKTKDDEEATYNYVYKVNEIYSK